MTDKKLILISLTLIMAIGLKAQETVAEKAFIKSLVEQEYDNAADTKNLNLSEIPYSVTVDDEGDPYTVYFSIITHEDLNNDNIDDYIVFRNSEGMLGGNVHSNQQYIFYMMKNDKEVDRKYEILGYAPFSYNIIDSTSYKNKILTAEITQNFRAYMAEDLQSTTVHFVYKDNNLYEESYLADCEMAKMKDKSIFKTDIPDIKRSLDIDMHNYTETASEEYIQGDTLIRASLSGCDNLALGFYVEIQVPQEKVSTKFYEKCISQTLDILIARTRYKTILGKIAVDYRSKSHKSNEAETVHIDNSWNYSISTYSYAKNSNTLSFWISAENIVNPNQEENWDITTRRK